MWLPASAAAVYFLIPRQGRSKIVADLDEADLGDESRRAICVCAARLKSCPSQDHGRVPQGVNFQTP
jgi:hypothetical protein